MKRLVVALMVANAMFFTWQLNEQISARIARARQSPPSAVNAPSLTLLSELTTPPALRPPPASPLFAAPPVPDAEVVAPSATSPVVENPGVAELPDAEVVAPSATSPMVENPGVAELPAAAIVAPGMTASVTENPGAAELPAAAIVAPSITASVTENPGAAELPVAAVVAPGIAASVTENLGTGELPVPEVVAPSTPASVTENPNAAELPAAAIVAPGMTASVTENPGAAELPGAAAAAPPVIKAKVPSGVCLRVGPYAKTADYAPLVAWLQPRASGVSVATTKRVQRKLFWIYLEPSSAVEAQTKLQDLARRGVHDYLLIRRTGVENAISLGVFSSQDAVNRRLAEIEKQGYRPIVVPRDETIDQHFVAARLNLGDEAIEAIPPALLGASKAQRVACDEAVQR